MILKMVAPLYIGGESFNMIYATILKKINFGATPLQ